MKNKKLIMNRISDGGTSNGIVKQTGNFPTGKNSNCGKGGYYPRTAPSHKSIILYEFPFRNRIIVTTSQQFFPCPTGRTQCWIEMSPWQWKLYISIVATTVFVVPAIVISGCYAIIVYTIWSKSKLLSPAKNNTLQRGTKSELL